MGLLNYSSAGEVHGKGWLTIVRGFPAGVPVDVGRLNEALWRWWLSADAAHRQKDKRPLRVEVLSGLKQGFTTGGPLSVLISWANRASSPPQERSAALPGRVDLPGAMKMQSRDLCGISEAFSFHQTSSTVAVGALAGILLSHFDISVFGYPVQIGSLRARPRKLDAPSLDELIRSDAYFAFEPARRRKVKEVLARAGREGFSPGGVVEVIGFNIPPGLGTLSEPRERLDARLAAAVMAIPGVKGFEIGLGFGAVSKAAGQAEDEVFFDAKGASMRVTGGFYRKTNREGGIEGGITNGETLLVRSAVKPARLPHKKADAIEIETKKKIEAAIEEPFVSSVPAVGVAAEAAVAFEIARGMCEKFGGDSIGEMKHNYCGYIDYIHNL